MVVVSSRPSVWASAADIRTAWSDVIPVAFAAWIKGERTWWLRWWEGAWMVHWRMAGAGREGKHGWKAGAGCQKNKKGENEQLTGVEQRGGVFDLAASEGLLDHGLRVRSTMGCG